MLIYKLFKFLFLLSSFIAFFSALFMGVYIVFNGGDLFLTAGENWFIYHNKSLYLTEPFISRYVQPFFNIFTDKDLWLDIIVANILEAATYVVLIATTIISFAIFILFWFLP